MLIPKICLKLILDEHFGGFGFFPNPLTKVSKTWFVSVTYASYFG